MYDGKKPFNEVYTNYGGTTNAPDYPEYFLFRKYKNAKVGGEVRYEAAPDGKSIFDKNRFKVFYVEPKNAQHIPPIDGYQLRVISGKVEDLEKTVNKLMHSKPKIQSIRVIRSKDTSGYAIFTK